MLAPASNVHCDRDATLGDIRQHTRQAPLFLRLVAQPSLAGTPTCRLVDAGVGRPPVDPGVQAFTQHAGDDRGVAGTISRWTVHGLGTLVPAEDAPGKGVYRGRLTGER